MTCEVVTVAFWPGFPLPMMRVLMSSERRFFYIQGLIQRFTDVFLDELLPCQLAPKINVNHEMKLEHVWLLACRAAYSLPKPEMDELLFQFVGTASQLFIH